MNPWTVLALLALVGAVMVLLPVAGTAFSAFRRPWRTRCPRSGAEAQVQVDALAAARAEVLGGGGPVVTRCSRWHASGGCAQECLDAPAADRRRVPPGRAALLAGEGRQAILVPLDGTRASEAILSAVRAVAVARQAPVRLLRVLPYASPVRGPDDRVVAYADQETARLEYEARVYLRSVASRLPGLDVEEAVRFGDPVAEIVGAADAPDVALIAMAGRRRSGARRLVGRRTVTERVERAAWVPLIRAERREAA